MLTSSNKEHCSTTYCLRNPGVEYLIYQPSSEPFYITTEPNKYTYEWFNPAQGKIISKGILYLGKQMIFKAPFTGDSVLYLKAMM